MISFGISAWGFSRSSYAMIFTDMCGFDVVIFVGLVLPGLFSVPDS